MLDKNITKKHVILLLCLLIFGEVTSQSFKVVLTPQLNFHCPIWKNEILKESTPNRIEVFKYSRFGNITFYYQSLGFDLGVIQLNNWNFGFSYFKSLATSSYKYRYYSEQDFSATASGVNGDFGVSGCFLRQIGLTSVYSLYRNRLVNNFHFNIYHQKNVTNYQGIPYNETIGLTDGNLSVYSLERNYPNRQGVCVQVKYSLSFLNKKKKELFNCYVGYQQGFVRLYEADITISHSLGYNISSFDYSKSSSLFFGISRNFKIYEKKNTLNN